MKLFGYECYKLLKNRYFLFVMFAVCLASVGIFYSNCIEEPMRVDQTLYHETLEAYRDLPSEQAYEEILAKQNDFFAVMTIRNQEMTVDPETAKQLYEAESIFYPDRKSYDQIKTEYAAYFADQELLAKQNTVIAELAMQYQSMLAYHDYIAGMSERANTALSGSIFSDQNSFTYRDIQKSLADFAHLSAEPYPIDLQRGVLAYSQDRLADWILLFWILICAVLPFSVEWENGLIHLLSVTRRGESALMSAKLSLLGLLTVGMHTVIRIGHLAIAQMTLGLGDLSRPIQSISAFRSCCFPITLGEYLLFSYLLKMLALLFVCSLTASVLLLFRNIKLSAVVLGVFFVLEYIAYQNIGMQSIYNPVKYLNLFSLLDTHGRFSVYQNLNLFGYPISQFSLLLPLAFLLTAGALVGIYLLHHRKFALHIAFPNVLPAAWSHQKIHGSSHLFVQENLKFWVRNKGILFLALAIIISLGSLETGEIFYTSDENAYMIYARELEGELTQQKQAFLDQMQAEFDAIPQHLYELSVQKAKGEISADDYDVKVSQLTNFSYQRKGFTQAREQYAQMTALKEQGIDVRFVNRIKAESFFGHASKVLLRGLILQMLLVFATFSIFAGEYEGDMLSLIRTTPNGQKRLFFAKYSVIWFAYPIFFVVCFAPEWYHWIVRYKMTDFTAPLQSVQRYITAKTDLNILGFSLIWYFAMFVGGLLLVHLVALLSAYLKSVSNTLICGSVLTGLCFLIVMIGDAKRMTVLPSLAFLFSKQFAYTADLTGMWLLPLFWSVLSVVSLLLHQNRMNRIRR